jgi:hypothetical protein
VYERSELGCATDKKYKRGASLLQREQLMRLCKEKAAPIDEKVFGAPKKNTVPGHMTRG